jgi:hypothetical protein
MLADSPAAGTTPEPPESELDAEPAPEGPEADGADGRTPPVCRAPEGVSDAPRSIASVVDLLNRLPRPVTVSCFLQALARPVELYATSGIFSAQPAVGPRSPRIFIFLDPLIMSVVPDGVGRELLELGELESNTRSLKAEIEFPLVDDLGYEAPFERLMYDDRITTCAFCHAAEEPSETIGFTQAFVSDALRPVPSERVALLDLYAEHQACSAEAEPERCEILGAIFENGQVIERQFPSEMATFY